VEIASKKEEYSAATLRSKIFRSLSQYLTPLSEETPKIDSINLNFDSINISDTHRAVEDLTIDRSVKSVACYQGGTKKAKEHLAAFVTDKLERYSDLRNDPNEDCLSNLSPYLHFGQISPVYVALEISRYRGPGPDAFLEELIVRRELSMNFVYYNPRYDSFTGLPNWVKRTLNEHKEDSREYIYSKDGFERAQTHDPYWNAAQKEMVQTGKMHGYMRMYWGKKILEWTASSEEAFRIALYLNNKYELDGRDPNGFTGIAWCFGKHDRPWGSRPIFGNIRYMSADGLKRKFDAEKYAQKYSFDKR
jgi:deoxyribodipyrimidine photo-lyase